MASDEDDLCALERHMRGLLHEDAPHDEPCGPVAPIPLIVDALNYLNFFTDGGRYKPEQSAMTPWEQVAVLRARVRGFLHACECSGFAPEFVVDAGWQTDENCRKWMARREAEVAECSRHLPLGMDSLLCDALVEAGGRVYRAAGLDGDDVVARMAVEMGPASLVLSADRDMFRYAAIFNATERICVDFALDRSGNRLTLVRSRHSAPKPGVGPRDVSALPYAPGAWLARSNKLHNARTRPHDGYVRGCCSPFVRGYGNLHGLARPLRLAAYEAMGVGGQVRESFPEWDERAGRVAWVDKLVQPDGALRPLLASPHEALEWLRERDPCALAGDHPLRAFARVSLLAELFDSVAGFAGFGAPRSILAIATELAGAEAERPLGKAARRACAWPPWSKVQQESPHGARGGGGRGARGSGGSGGAGRSAGDGRGRGRGRAGRGREQGLNTSDL